MLDAKFFQSLPEHLRSSAKDTLRHTRLYHPLCRVVQTAILHHTILAVLLGPCAGNEFADNVFQLA